MVVEDRSSGDAACNLCGGTNRVRRFLSTGQLVYSRCRTCGLIVQDPLPSQRELGEIYRTYFRERGSLRGLSYGYADYDHERSPAHFRARYLKWLWQYVKPGRGTFLDFGCGTGNLIQVLTAEGVDAQGCEFSEEVMSVLTARRIPFFPYSDLERTSARFAYVAMLDVIEHLRDPAGDLKRISDLIEPEGMLFIETINADDPLARYVYRSRWQGISPLHLYLFGETTLRRLLAERGFEVIELERYKMGGMLLRQLALRAAAYGVAGAWPLIARRERVLGYATDRLQRFADWERRSSIQLTLGDGLRVIARKAPPQPRTDA
jgi:2-polyprenyl-3-methyl-5-hydroxy-6-metoxy-1,4-benzoquinol methylase